MVLRRRGRDYIALRHRLWMEIAISLAILTQVTIACQDIDAFQLNIVTCHKPGDSEWCSLDTSEIVKLNPFKREACLLLTKNDSTVLEVTLLWEHLQLFCDKTSVLLQGVHGMACWIVSDAPCGLVCRREMRLGQSYYEVT
ncbi:hypothetical protein GCK32_016165 [Trichostrongylus colubriformis]|uniref:Phlebovirus glycoprotein G2 fusion domain-containing protein n=1 Tax=Trichostrongylus colubriformis TaxID=6319 RepID=A0AAN8IH01_TRICO